jgi:hypothetical protein
MDMTIATRRGVALGVVLWATVLTVGVQAQTVETNAVAGCEKDIKAQMEDLGGKYTSDVDMLRVKFQSQGDLNHTLAVKGELDRFAATRRLASQDVAKEPLALREVQEKYLVLQGQVPQQVSRRWVEQLERAKRELTIAGKLDEAQQAQGQIDALRKAYGGATVSVPAITSPAMPTTALETCDKNVASRRKDFLLKYRIELTALKTAAQQEGDLDGVLATDKEYRRVLGADTLNEQDLVTKPETLRELQRKYIGQLANVERATATEHIERLKETKRQLTVAGKIADAVGTQKDIEKLEAKYLGGGGTSGVGDTGGSTDDVVEQCERAIQERTAKMHAEYEQQLAQLAVNYQKRGELEKLLVVKSEQERFGRVKQIAERDVVEAPDELAQLQAKYQQAPEAVKLTVATEWLSKLQEQKKRLTMENKLDKALEVQKQMDTIIRKYDIKALPQIKRTAAAAQKQDPLGRVWNITEAGDWVGTWTRRENTNVFDAKTRNKHNGYTLTYSTVVTITGQTITAQRTGNDQNGYSASYTGVIAADGRSIEGTYRNWRGTRNEQGQWFAQITW